MEIKEYTLPYWLDEATGIYYAKDCATCGGAGQVHRGEPGNSCDYTCDTCHGSGVVPADDCPEVVAKLIRDASQRLVFEADEDWDERGSDYEGQECPVCGYDLDHHGACTGNGCGADLSS